MSAPVITSPAVLTVGTTGSAYSVTLTATGASPFVWTLVDGSLPSGVTLSSGGVISGTPSAYGEFTFTLRATDTNGDYSEVAFVIRVNASVYDDLMSGLAEEDARMWTSKSAEQSATRELQRYWPDLMLTSANALEPYRMFLEQYCSTKNYPTKRRYVSDPMVDGLPYSGTWRCAEVNIKMQGQVPYIVQVMRYGWIESVVKQDGSVDFSEARILAPGFYDPLRNFAVLVWRNVSAEKVTAVADAIPATINSPSVYGQALPTGTWYRKYKKAITADDGSGVVILAISQEPDEVTGIRVEETASSYTVRAQKRFDKRADAITYSNTNVVSAVGVSARGGFEQIGEELFSAWYTLTASQDQKGGGFHRVVGSETLNIEHTSLNPIQADPTDSDVGYGDSANVGETITFSKRPTADGNVSTQASKVVERPLDSGIIKFYKEGTGPTLSRSLTGYSAVDAQAVLDAMFALDPLQTQSGRVSIAPNGLISVHIHASPQNTNGSQGGGDAYRRDYSESKWLTLDYKNRFFVRKGTSPLITEDVTCNYVMWQELITSSKADANAFLKEAMATYPPPAGYDGRIGLVSECGSFRTHKRTLAKKWIAVMRVYVK